MATAQRVAASRLLHRFGFGPAGDDFVTATASVDAAVAQIIAGTSDANAALDQARTPMPVLDYISLATAGTRAAMEEQRREQERTIKLWWLDRMVTTEQPLLERLTWFWHGHWATSQIKVRDARLMLQQNQTLRANALGDFGAMSRLMLRDPAVLIWLDGKGNKKGRPNENLAREFLELFTLGVGNYSEHDVRESARALTGWQLDLPSGTATRNDKQFDEGTKSVLGYTGSFDVDSLAELVITQPQCATFIANRLWRHLGSVDPITPEQLQVVRTAFGSGHNLAAAVFAMVNLVAVTEQPLMWVKSPVDWAVSTLRVIGVRPGDLAPGTQSGLLNDLNAMGQMPFFPPNVSGWPAGSAWLSAASTQARIRCSQRLIVHAPGWLKRVPPRQRPTVLADRLAVPEWSAPTQRVLADAANSAQDALVVALNSPDYLVGA